MLPGCISERISHSSMLLEKGNLIASEFESKKKGVQGSSCARSTCHKTYVHLMWCQREIISEVVVPISRGMKQKCLYRRRSLEQNGSKDEESKGGMEMNCG